MSGLTLTVGEHSGAMSGLTLAVGKHSGAMSGLTALAVGDRSARKKTAPIIATGAV